MANQHQFNGEMFREHYRRRYGITGRPYEFYQVGYRYGWDLGCSEEYEGQAMSLIEGSLRRDWNKRYPHRSWDEFRDAITEGWRIAREALAAEES